MSATSGTTEARHIDPVVAVNKDTALKEMKVAIGVAALGGMMAFAGTLGFLFRLKFAETFLGARTWFNVPVSDADSMKVIFIALQSLQAVAIGGLSLCVALAFAWSKWNQMQDKGSPS
jgi:hypothetical protein